MIDVPVSPPFPLEVLDTIGVSKRCRELLDILVREPAGVSRAAAIEHSYRGADAASESTIDSFRHLLVELNRGLYATLAYGFKAQVIYDRTDKRLRWIVKRTSDVYGVGPVPVFAWTCGNIKREQPYVLVPMVGDDLPITFRVCDGRWAPPSYPEEYLRFRSERWELEKNPFLNQKTLLWHVGSFRPLVKREDPSCSGIELAVQLVEFQDVVATTWSMKEEISLPEGDKTIYAWLKDHRDPRRLTHFVPAANPLQVQVNVLTSDKKFISRWYGGRKGKWCAAVLAYMDPIQDVWREQVSVPNPGETFFRQFCRRFGLSVSPAKVSWLGVGFGRSEGKVSVFGQVQLRYTAQQIVDRAFTMGKTRTAKPADANNGAAPEEGDLRVDDFSGPGIAAFLGTNPDTNINSHFQVLLALGLSRCQKVTIRFKLKMPRPKRTKRALATEQNASEPSSRNVDLVMRGSEGLPATARPGAPAEGSLASAGAAEKSTRGRGTVDAKHR